jgi:hypothetical protein
MSFDNTESQWNFSGFKSYLDKIGIPWHPAAVTIHHTAMPALCHRPQGLTTQHMRNIRHYYENSLNWSTGPHLFVDDTEIPFKGMTPFEEKGTHARSYNRDSWGIEVLGNYDQEDPKTGRGLECWKNAALATSILLKRIGKHPDKTSIRFHRDDPKTSKTCPGKKVTLDWFLGLVKEYGDFIPVLNTSPKSEEDEHLDAIDWQIANILKEDPRDSDEKGELQERLNHIKWRATQLIKT